MKTLFRINEKGYSLVEVLVVIVILGIIASIGLVSISNVI
jgi:prepilin-type N-terminal cleavage/methylation domain-containing protein